MCASTPREVRNWSRVFLLVESFVILACLYGLTVRISWNYDRGEHYFVMATWRFLCPMSKLLFFSFLTAAVFLMLGGPCFLCSLRSTALRAWVIGVAGLLTAGGLFLSFVL